MRRTTPKLPSPSRRCRQRGCSPPAARTGCAIVVVRHLTKSGSTNPLYRGVGSIGIIGAAPRHRLHRPHRGPQGRGHHRPQSARRPWPVGLDPHRPHPQRICSHRRANSLNPSIAPTRPPSAPARNTLASPLAQSPSPCAQGEGAGGEGFLRAGVRVVPLSCLRRAGYPLGGGWG
jgi:hypothetical protein